MNEAQATAQLLEMTFNDIHQHQMQGIPILNNQLKVQALGFHEYQGRILGVLITPWLMNIVMFPAEDEDWGNLKIGQKQTHQFPSKRYNFMVNEVEGIGHCQTYSIYSPMNEFINQEHALSAAQSFLDGMMVEKESTEEDTVDEELLGRILRGEDQAEMELDELTMDGSVEAEIPLAEPITVHVRTEKKLSRRDLLRGSFISNT